MVNFLKKLVAIVAALFLFCLAFCPPATILCSNEIVEALFSSKAVWLIALILALCPTGKRTAPDRAVSVNNQAVAKHRSLHLIKMEEDSQQKSQAPSKDDDDILISPK